MQVQTAYISLSQLPILLTFDLHEFHQQLAFPYYKNTRLAIFWYFSKPARSLGHRSNAMVVFIKDSRALLTISRTLFNFRNGWTSYTKHVWLYTSHMFIHEMGYHRCPASALHPRTDDNPVWVVLHCIETLWRIDRSDIVDDCIQHRKCAWGSQDETRRTQYTHRKKRRYCPARGRVETTRRQPLASRSSSFSVLQETHLTRFAWSLTLSAVPKHA